MVNKNHSIDYNIPYDSVEDEEFEVEETPTKKITSLEDASRYAYGLAKTREEMEKIKEVAEKEIAKWQERIDQVKAWQEEVLKPLQQKAEYFETLLMAYHMEEYEKADEKAKSKIKSIKLPYGVTLKSRELPDEYQILDEEKFLEFAKSNDLLNDPKPPAPKWGEIKKQLEVTDKGVVFKGTGEIIDFIKIIPQGRKFEVK